VVDGEAQRLAAHLARLGGSLTELYGRALPPDLEARARSLVRTARGPARLRIDVVPGADAELSLARALQRELPIVLHPYTLPGGLGAHKWRDRTLVDALRQRPCCRRCSPKTLPSARPARLKLAQSEPHHEGHDDERYTGQEVGAEANEVGGYSPEPQPHERHQDRDGAEQWSRDPGGKAEQAQARAGECIVQA